MPCLSRLSSALEQLGINRAVGVGRGRPRTPLTDAIGYFDDRWVRAYRGVMRFRGLKEVKLGSFNTHLGLALGGGLAVILAAVGLSRDVQDQHELRRAKQREYPIRAMTCDVNNQPFRWPVQMRELCRGGRDLNPGPHAFTRFPDAADLSMAAMTSWRRTASAKSGTV